MSDGVKALRAQGVYYLVTGAWPILHRRSFEALTGPKPDVFVLETAGGLFAAIGVAVLYASRQQPPAPAVGLLATLAPVISLTVTIRHARRIRRVYLADAALETVLALRVLAARFTR